MSVPIIEQADAEAEFRRLANPSECPELLNSEWLAILARHKRGVLWTASAVREIGSGLAIIPTLANRNGHRFDVVRYVTTNTDRKNGITEPVWGTGQELEYTDGNVVLREAGWDWDAVLWDFNAAAKEAWIEKKARSVLKTDFQLPSGMSVSASQINKHCDDMIKHFRTISVA